MKENNNLDETKVFSNLNDKSDNNDFSEETKELDIPFSKLNNEDTTEIKSSEDKDLEKTVVLSEDELIDEGLSNIKAAEAEINSVIENQNDNINGNGDGEDNMGKKKKKKLSGLGKFNVLLLVLIFLMISGFGAAGVIWANLSVGTPDLDIAVLANEKSSKLLDINGEEFFDLGMYTEEGTTFKDFKYKDMSQNVIDAFVSIEDSRFFKHQGFDVPRFTKAIIENVQAGGFAQGGSTITMQLIKTSHLTSAKKVSRKAQEINLALDLEEKISKEKIFEYYVNKINYGAGNTRGIEGAAQYYFDKSASQLSISESALLAGVVNRPNAFDPINNLDSAYKRRNQVIDLMEYHGYIDEEEANLAKAVKIENQLSNDSNEELSVKKNPYLDYVNAVIDEVDAEIGVDIVATPLTIYTNMDPKIQEDVDAIQKSEGYQYPDELMQSAVAIGDNDTGAILALGAGRDSQVVKGRNRATRMFQQPGSVTKPLLSYALAFEHLGWATSHVVEDRPVMYAGTDIILGNFDGRFRGEMRLKDALARSINTPAYLALLDVEQEISRYAVADYLHDSLGFSKVSRENYNTQYAIGGSTFSVSPAELFGAQAVMMNGGFYTKPHTVRYVETADNEIIKDEFEHKKTRVISEETAYLVSVLEEYNVNSGIVNRMEILANKPYQVYAKTGTTDYGDDFTHLGIPENAGKDQWMMASSRDYTSVVWMGWDKPEAGKGTWWSGYKYAMNPLGKMNYRLLDTIHKDKENPGSVARPAGVSQFKHVLSTFPYANPIEGMDSEYITTGEINKKYLNLKDLDKAGVDLENVEEFSASISANKKDKTVNLTWSEYPEDGEIKDKTYDISLGNVKATGTRLFHPSWIFGPVQYKASVYVDGQKLEEIVSETNTMETNLKIPDNKEVKICGYYGNSKQNGSENCTDVENPNLNKEINIPKFNTKSEIEAFIKENKLNSENWTTASVSANSQDDIGKVANVKFSNMNIVNKNFRLESLKDMQIVVNIYDGTKLFAGSYEDFEDWASDQNIQNVVDNEPDDESRPVVKYRINEDPNAYLPNDFYKGKIKSIQAFVE